MRKILLTSIASILLLTLAPSALYAAEPLPDLVPCGQFRLMHFRSLYNYDIDVNLAAIVQLESLKVLVEGNDDAEEQRALFDKAIAIHRATIELIAVEQLDRFPLLGVSNDWVRVNLSGSAAPDNGTDTMVLLGTRHAQGLALTCI